MRPVKYAALLPVLIACPSIRLHGALLCLLQSLLSLKKFRKTQGVRRRPWPLGSYIKLERFDLPPRFWTRG